MMLRNSLIAGLALAALGAGAAQAIEVDNSVQGTVYVNGTVADRCSFTLDSVTLNLLELSAPDGTLNTGAVDTKNANLTGWCNGTAAEISVQANPLMNTSYTVPIGGLPPGFTNRVDFTGTASAGAGSAFDSSVGAANFSAPSSVGIFNGNIHVVLSSSAATGKLIAGTYNGSVVVTLTPNVSLPSD